MKDLTIEDYEKYMKTISETIHRIKQDMNNLDAFEKISNLSFDEWKNFINGNLKIK